MATDSLYADSIMDYLIENGITDCGTDCRFGLVYYIVIAEGGLMKKILNGFGRVHLQMTQSVQYVIEH